MAKRTDINPTENLCFCTRMLLECCLRMARSALKQGATQASLAENLTLALPPIAAEFIFYAATATPDGPTLQSTGSSAMSDLLRMNGVEPDGMPVRRK